MACERPAEAVQREEGKHHEQVKTHMAQAVETQIGSDRAAQSPSPILPRLFRCDFCLQPLGVSNRSMEVCESETT